MLRARILPFCCLLLVCAAVRAAESPVRLYSEEGWKIPRLSKVLAGHPAKEEKLDWGASRGASHVTARSFELGSAPDGGYRVLFLSREDETNYVTWRSIGPRTVTAYSIGKRLFGVLIEGVVELSDPKTGQGGTGGETRLYYEDADGSGKLKLLLENLPVTFRPEIPEWARKPAP